MLAFPEMLKSSVKRVFSKRSGASKQFFEKGMDLLAIILSIYLALSIEGWAEKRNEHKKLLQYYENMTNELVKDTVSIARVIADAKMHMQSGERQLKLLKEYKPENQDTISNLFRRTLSSEIFGSSSMVSYQSMVVSGEIKLIEDLKVRAKLIELDEEYKSLKIWEDLYLDFFRKELMDAFFQSFDLLDMRMLDKEYYKKALYRNLVVKYYSFNMSRYEEAKKAMIQAKETYMLLLEALHK
jgi:hypothetical protein